MVVRSRARAAAPPAGAGRPRPSISAGSSALVRPVPTRPRCPSRFRCTMLRGRDIDEGFYVPPKPFIGPFSHPNYENGGFYFGAEFVFTSPRRGRSCRNRSPTAGSWTPPACSPAWPARWSAAAEEALNTNQVQGQGSFQPGVNIFFGYDSKRRGGAAGVAAPDRIALLRQCRRAAHRPESGQLRGRTLPVRSGDLNWPNWPTSGNFSSVLIGGVPAVGATPGIWNAASEMSEQFIQRLEIIQLHCRVPWWETENYRAYGTFGPRAIHHVGRIRMVHGPARRGRPCRATPARLVHQYHVEPALWCLFGTGHDWYLWIRALRRLRPRLQLNGGLYMDFVKGRAGYELANKSTENHRATNFYSLVPGFDGKIGLMWYPWEAIQVGSAIVLRPVQHLRLAAADRLRHGHRPATIRPGNFRFIQGLTFGVGAGVLRCIGAATVRKREPGSGTAPAPPAP